MCGILAGIGVDGSCKGIGSNLSRLMHRGPDSQGTREVSVLGTRIILGMTRLKIVDLTEIPVPFYYSYLNVSLAYNGEIYNLQELREDLSNGMPWQTRCDAEVVARAWRRYGPRCLEHFNGMWGLILIDEIRNEIFIARDRAGKKPLYLMTPRPGLTYITSEPKALPAALRVCPCADMDALEYDIGPSTPLAGVWQLPPGGSIHLTHRAQLSNPWRHSKIWWSLPEPDREDHDLTFAAAVDKAEALIISAVKMRRPEEVKQGVLLSGGLDSSIIQAILKADHTYCVTFPEIDSIGDARLVDGSVSPVSFSPAELREALPQIAFYLDTPATWSAGCLWFLHKRMHEEGVRVALSGEGADEVFGGYSRYAILHWLDQLRADPRLKQYRETVDHVVGARDQTLVRILCRGETGESSQRCLELIQTHGAGATSLLSTAARVEFATTMQVLLRMADRMSMAHSIETRNPFLDHRIVELGFMLPDNLRVTGIETKPVLREVGRRLGIHPSITDAKAKRGLAIPWQSWRYELGLGDPIGDSPRGSWNRSAFFKLIREHFEETVAAHPPCSCYETCHKLQT